MAKPVQIDGRRIVSPDIQRFPIYGSLHSGERERFKAFYFGRWIVAKETYERFDVYSVWYPAVARPIREPQDRIGLHDKMQVAAHPNFAGDVHFEQLESHRFLPGVVPEGYHDMQRRNVYLTPTEVRNFWEVANQERVRLFVHAHFPETRGELSFMDSSGYLINPSKRMLTTNHLDDIVDQWKFRQYFGLPVDEKEQERRNHMALVPYAGFKVFHDMFNSGTLVETGGTWAVRWRMQCHRQRCKKRMAIYTVRGCHHGAWCYAIDSKTGKHFADLRNDLIYCRSCSK